MVFGFNFEILIFVPLKSHKLTGLHANRFQMCFIHSHELLSKPNASEFLLPAEAALLASMTSDCGVMCPLAIR